MHRFTSTTMDFWAFDKGCLFFRQKKLFIPVRRQRLWPTWTARVPSLRVSRGWPWSPIARCWSSRRVRGQRRGLGDIYIYYTPKKVWFILSIDKHDQTWSNMSQHSIYGNRRWSQIITDDSPRMSHAIKTQSNILTPKIKNIKHLFHNEKQWMICSP